MRPAWIASLVLSVAAVLPVDAAEPTRGSHNRARGTIEPFVFACDAEGPLAGVPVFVRCPPKWWFKIEGVLGEGETLSRRGWSTE